MCDCSKTHTKHRVGDRLRVIWPLTDGSEQWHEATIADTKQTKRGYTKYLLSWASNASDGDNDAKWTRLVNHVHERLPVKVIQRSVDATQRKRRRDEEPTGSVTNSNPQIRERVLKRTPTVPSRTKHQDTRKYETTANIGKKNHTLSNHFSWECEEGDHAETPLNAFEHVDMFLYKLARKLKTSKARLRLYDPYFCHGAAARFLNQLGYGSVYNKPEDFYTAVREGSTPDYDVLITNPPFGDEHVERCLQFCIRSKKPWMLLLPNYCYEKPYFKKWTRHTQVTFVCPDKRYKFMSPKFLRPDLTNNQRKFVGPTPIFWFLGGLDQCMPLAEIAKIDVPGAQVATSVQHIPDKLKSKDKNTPLVKFRKAFNDFCRSNQFGRLCQKWAINGDCSCDRERPSPFLHPSEVKHHVLRRFVELNPPPQEGGWSPYLRTGRRPARPKP